MVLSSAEAAPDQPYPAGWDWIFSTTDRIFVLITLADGTEIAGYFGGAVHSSSEPERKDIYIESVYKIPESGGPWEAVEDSLGMLRRRVQNSVYRVQR